MPTVLHPVLVADIGTIFWLCARRFFMWDKALKLGDARQVGTLSYITPLASTSLLMLCRAALFLGALDWPQP